MYKINPLEQSDGLYPSFKPREENLPSFGRFGEEKRGTFEFPELKPLTKEFLAFDEKIDPLTGRVKKKELLNSFPKLDEEYDPVTRSWSKKRDNILGVGFKPKYEMDFGGNIRW